jgi:hypothetical protein
MQELTAKDVGSLIAVVLVALLYLLPSIVAFARHHHYRWPIAVVNVLAGWTLIGLLACFVWAVWPRDGWERQRQSIQ